MNSASIEPPLQKIASDLFRDFKGDEIGGRHAIRGFSFQVWHAVLEALRAHKTGTDYAVVLEWQQDIAILDSSVAPKRVRFVQLKKRETSPHWKLANLVNVPPGPGTSEDGETEATAGGQPTDEVENLSSKTVSDKPPKKKVAKKPKLSILAKLYEHRRRFKSLALSRIEFSSDAHFEIPDELGVAGMHSKLELSSATAHVKNAIEAKLREQLGLDSSEAIDFSDFALVVSDCPVDEPHKYLAGELAEMQVQSELNLSGSATILAVLIIASYIFLRAGSRRHAKSFNELLERAVTRTDIDLYLAAADEQTVSTRQHIEEIIERLNIEAAPFSLVKNMKKELVRACIEITNRAGTAPLVAAHLKALYDDNSEYGAHPKLTDLLARWYEEFEALKMAEARDYTREYIYCLMSMIIQNANPTKQLPSISFGAKSEDAQ